MRKSWVVWILALGIAVAGLTAWFLNRPSPTPLIPIDYKAELTKLAMQHQPGDPSAENGWDALVGVGADTGAIITSIVDRETDADQTLRLAGKEAEIESWSWEPFGGGSCEPRTPRDDRISAEAWQRVTDEHILDRLKRALAHDVFVMDFDERLGAQMRTNWGGVQTSEVPSKLRHLARVLNGAAERAMECGDWNEALARIKDQMALARVVGMQPDTIMSLTAGAILQMAQQTIQDTVLRRELPPRPFIEAARDALRTGPMMDADVIIEVQQLEAKEMIDVSAELMRSGGTMAAISAGLRGWTPTEEARTRVNEWGARIRAMPRDDPRGMQAERTAVVSEIASVEGIHALGLSSMSGAARVVELSANQRRQRDVFEIIIALSLYTSAHGSPPQTLDALVPEFLAELPKDPWAPDGKFRYKPGPTMKEIVLYSVGYDGEDNGGYYIPRREDRAWTPEGKGQDYVFTRDACQDVRENPEVWEQP